MSLVAAAVRLRSLQGESLRPLRPFTSPGGSRSFRWPGFSLVFLLAGSVVLFTGESLRLRPFTSPGGFTAVSVARVFPSFFYGRSRGAAPPPM